MVALADVLTDCWCLYEGLEDDIPGFLASILSLASKLAFPSAIADVRSSTLIDAKFQAGSLESIQILIVF